MALSTNWAQTNIVNKWSELREELDEEKEEKERIKFPPSRNGPAGACLQVVITCGHTPALFFPCNKLFILLPYSSSSSSPLHRRENQTWLVFHQLLFWLSGHVDSSLTHYPVSLTTSCFFFFPNIPMVGNGSWNEFGRAKPHSKKLRVLLLLRRCCCLST